ncbi:hypothetical protein BaRGS_00007434, partial [Batillaria attramentaria]
MTFACFATLLLAILAQGEPVQGWHPHLRWAYSYDGSYKRRQIVRFVEGITILEDLTVPESGVYWISLIILSNPPRDVNSYVTVNVYRNREKYPSIPLSLEVSGTVHSFGAAWKLDKGDVLRVKSMGDVYIYDSSMWSVAFIAKNPPVFTAGVNFPMFGPVVFFSRIYLQGPGISQDNRTKILEIKQSGNYLTFLSIAPYRLRKYNEAEVILEHKRGGRWQAVMHAYARESEQGNVGAVLKLASGAKLRVRREGGNTIASYTLSIVRISSIGQPVYTGLPKNADRIFKQGEVVKFGDQFAAYNHNSGKSSYNQNTGVFTNAEPDGSQYAVCLRPYPRAGGRCSA